MGWELTWTERNHSENSDSRDELDGNGDLTIVSDSLQQPSTRTHDPPDPTQFLDVWDRNSHTNDITDSGDDCHGTIHEAT